MKYLFYILFDILIFFQCTSLLAQSNFVSLGGEVSSPTGAISYSVGQVDYTNIENVNGAVTEGVQQPKEFYLMPIDKVQDAIVVNVFPNPSSGLITLELDKDICQESFCELLTIDGKKLKKILVEGDVTEIVINDLVTGVYVLKISCEDYKDLYYKIIKL